MRTVLAIAAILATTVVFAWAVLKGHEPVPPLHVEADLAELAGRFTFLAMCAGAIERAVELLLVIVGVNESVEARRRRALALALVFGVLLALAGVRLLGAVVATPIDALARGVFHAVDIVLTACLMAAGSDVLHQYVEAIQQFGVKLRRYAPGAPKPDA